MIKRIIASCCVIVALGLSAVGVLASSTAGYVSVSYQIDDTPVQDLEFNLYDVGTVDTDTNSIVWNNEYSGYNISSSLDDSVASTLYGYIQRDKLSPSAKSSTDPNGICTFPGLDDGLYLITGSVYETDGYSYYVQPLLATVPSSGISDVKHEAVPTGNGEGSSKKLSVKKVWDSERVLDSVSVDLLMNGNLYKTVDLSKKNNWSYTWNNLPSSGRYSIVESSVPRGYMVDITSSKDRWTITNKSNDIGAGRPTIKPGQEHQNLTPMVPDWQYGGKLPQTGMHHMAVLVLCGLSVLSGVLGIIFVKITNRIK